MKLSYIIMRLFTFPATCYCVIYLNAIMGRQVFSIVYPPLTQNRILAHAIYWLDVSGNNRKSALRVECENSYRDIRDYANSILCTEAGLKSLEAKT